MSSNSSNPDESPNQSLLQRWKFVISLSEGDEVLVNDREQRLVVREISQREDSSAATHTTLVGNGTEYTMIATDYPNVPMITWPSAAHTRPVQEIRPAGTTILSTTRASDVLTQTLSLAESVDKKQEQLSKQLDITRLLGSCPICDSMVTSDTQRAVCRKCGAWCWIEHWGN
jgi:hypothetical protein